MKSSRQVEAEASNDMRALEVMAQQLSFFAPGVPLRNQWDSHDEITRAGGLVCPPEENRTRPEFAAEADVNNIVARFWPFAPPNMRPVQYGEQDLSLDLQSAVLSMQAARESYVDAPAALRAQFPTFKEFLDAVMNGEVEFVPKSADGGGGGSPTPSGDSPSESAAGDGK